MNIDISTANLQIRWPILPAVVIVALSLSLPLTAQTTFTGSWEEWQEYPQYYTFVDWYTEEPAPGDGIRIKYAPMLVTLLNGEKVTVEGWKLYQLTNSGWGFNDVLTDNHWTNPMVWSDGLPDLNSDVYIRDSRTGPDRNIILPAGIEPAATARSLSIFATEQDTESGNYISQVVTISGGTLNLTPLAMNESLRVGVASPLPKYRNSALILDGATLTSSGFAMIGVGLPAGAGGALQSSMTLENGAQWFHPAGSIELGGGDGSGTLSIKSGSVLGGSLIPGAEANPQVIIKPGSRFNIELGGTARLAELHLDSGLFEQMNYSNYSGVTVSGTLETALLHLGETASGAWAQILTGSTSQLGEVIIENHSTLSIAGAATASSIALRDGVIIDQSGLLIGDAGNPAGSIILLKMAEAAGSIASYFAGYGTDTIVYGSAQLCGYGTAFVSVGANTTLDIRGSATLGRSESSEGGAAGNGSVYVDGGVFRVQNIEVGYSYFDSYSYNPYPSPTGLLSVRGRVEVTGYITGDGWSMLPDAEGNYAYGPTVEAGYMTIGKNGTLRIQASGKVAFTDPTGGAAVRVYGNQQITNYGLITGGGTSASTPESGGHIDFGAVGGTLANVGRIAPGQSAGWLTVNGDLAFNNPMGMGSGGKLLIELGGTTAGLGYDVLDVWGNADLTGATVEFSLINGYSPQLGDTFTFLLVGGDLTGMFATLVDNTGLGLTLADLSFAEGGGLMLTMPVSAVPEPSTYAVLVGLGALGFAWAARRQRR